MVQISIVNSVNAIMSGATSAVSVTATPSRFWFRRFRITAQLVFGSLEVFTKRYANGLSVTPTKSEIGYALGASQRFSLYNR